MFFGSGMVRIMALTFAGSAFNPLAQFHDQAREPPKKSTLELIKS